MRTEEVMTLSGDIGLARFPHATGARGKKRPAVVVQADSYNSKVRHVLVAEITTNLASANDPAHLLIDISTPDGKTTGLLHDSVVSCLFLSVNQDRIDPIIGRLSDALQQQLNHRLKAAMDLP
jgi:mRNA-degrading endonuclease toxin of MazEF toxin-antitoxin module